MKITFITTVFNEENSVGNFFDSLFLQSVLPNEIIVTDAFSSDKTEEIFVSKTKQFQKFNKRTVVKYLKIQGNRSSGRNFAIQKAVGEIIICSDAGCILNKNWIKNITKPFKETGVDVVAGFYKPITFNVFEKCLAAYTCFPEDKLNGDFLPSSRSIGFLKSAWEKVEGYPEHLDKCEDLVFARNLKKAGFRFRVVKNAIVYWPQRKNIKEAFIQFFSYAQGDGQALYIRPQVLFLYVRYFIGLTLLILTLTSNNYMYGLAIVGLFFLYSIWSVLKNYKYIKKKEAVIILPMIQILADIAVLSGTTLGIFKKITSRSHL